MILPDPCASICFPACLLKRNTLERFVSMTVCQSSSECSTAGARRIIPALLTRISMEPKWWTTCSTRRSHTEAWLTSPITANGFAPALFSFSSDASGTTREPWTATSAPASASARAIPAPSPRDDPVTSAVLPFRLKRSKIKARSFLPRANRQRPGRPYRYTPDFLRPCPSKT